MITKKQYPANLHSVFIPVHYTYSTDISYEDDFRFKYELSDLDGIFFTGLTVPLEQSLSYNTPLEVLKNKTLFNFQPEIIAISNIENNALTYVEEVKEDIVGGDTDTWFVKTAFRYSDPLFEPTENFINADETSDFLVNMPQQHNIRLTDHFTFRTYNGFPDINDEDNAGLVYTYRMRIYMDTEQAHTMNSMLVESMPNNYYGSPASSLFTPTVNADNFNIELPAGVANWNNQAFKLLGVWDTSDTFLPSSCNIVISVADDGKIKEGCKLIGAFNGYIDNYDYYAYRWPYGDEGRISLTHNFKVIQNCRFNAVNVAWENTKGGIDYYLFTKANEKSIVTNKDIYKQNLYKLNLTDSLVQKNAYNKGANVYRNSVETLYELHTDWLTQAEIDGIEDIFHSTEVFMNINTIWNFVISTEKKAVIYNKKRKGLKKYVLNLLVSENKVRY